MLQSPIIPPGYYHMITGKHKIRKTHADFMFRDVIKDGHYIIISSSSSTLPTNNYPKF